MTQIKIPPTNPVRFTLSIGVAVWVPEENDSVVSMMKKADIALYEVKGRGRDGVCIYQSANTNTESE